MAYFGAKINFRAIKIIAGGNVIKNFLKPLH
jgi:hypothetical protein